MLLAPAIITSAKKSLENINFYRLHKIPLRVTTPEEDERREGLFFYEVGEGSRVQSRAFLAAVLCRTFVLVRTERRAFTYDQESS